MWKHTRHVVIVNVHSNHVGLYNLMYRLAADIYCYHSMHYRLRVYAYQHGSRRQLTLILLC